MLFIFYCNSEGCIKTLPFLKQNKIIAKNDNKVIIRYLPIHNHFDFQFEIDGPPLKSDIIFISSKHSKGYDYFRYSLDDILQGYANDNSITDVVLKNSTNM